MLYFAYKVLLIHTYQSTREGISSSS